MGWVHSANITSDPVGGIGAWSDEELARMIKTGIGRDHRVRPMPQFCYLGDEDVAGVIAFLRSGDPMFAPSPTAAVGGGYQAQAGDRHCAGRHGAAHGHAQVSLLRRRRAKVGTAPPRQKPANGAPPEQLFTQLGCIACHGEAAPFRAKIRQCIGKPVDETAKWIRHPEVTKPGTQMPTFAELVDEPTARGLAEWVQKYAANQKWAAQ